MIGDDESFDEVVYAETRNINIGDYESRSVFISLKTKVKKINKKNNTISIHDSSKCSVSEFDGNVKRTIIHARDIVRERLDAEERKIRVGFTDFAGDYLLDKLEINKRIKAQASSKKKRRT
jgi:hypothetical protein